MSSARPFASTVPSCPTYLPTCRRCACHSSAPKTAGGMARKSRQISGLAPLSDGLAQPRTMENEARRGECRQVHNTLRSCTSWSRNLRNCSQAEGVATGRLVLRISPRSKKFCEDDCARSDGDFSYETAPVGVASRSSHALVLKRDRVKKLDVRRSRTTSLICLHNPPKLGATRGTMLPASKTPLYPAAHHGQ